MQWRVLRGGAAAADELNEIWIWRLASCSCWLSYHLKLSIPLVVVENLSIYFVQVIVFVGKSIVFSYLRDGLADFGRLTKIYFSWFWKG
jgi:hypothetical protein